MTWLGQLRHVLVKDLIEHRWTVALYLAAVLAATGHTLEWYPFTAPILGSTMLLVGLIGGVLAASIVQGDSPTRSDAFWASHPLDASAMLATKLVLAAAILALPLVAQVLALHAYDVSWTDAISRSLHDLRIFALIVLGALVVAALTRDLKSFVLAVLAIPITLGICVAILSARTGTSGFSLNPHQAAAATLLCAFVELVLLVWLYHTRDARWLTRLVGFALVGLSFVGLGMASVPVSTNDTRVATGVPHVRLRVDWATRRDWPTPSPLAMNLVIGAPPAGLRYTLRDPSITVRARDGSTANVWVASNEFEPGQYSLATPPVMPGFRWLNATPADGDRDGAERAVALDPMMSDDQRRQFHAGIESVVLKGYIAVTQLAPGDTLSVAAGATKVAHGERVRVERWHHGPDGTWIDVRIRRVAGPSIFSPPDFGNWIDYALINASRGEAVALRLNQRGFSGQGMVIPGSTMTSEQVRYTVRAAAAGGPAIDDAWLRGAKLRSIDAVSLGSYPFTLPPLAAPPGIPAPGEEETPGGR